MSKKPSQDNVEGYADCLVRIPPKQQDIGRVVYFHEDHVCEHGVCEHDPHDIRAVLVDLNPSYDGGDRSITVEMLGEKMRITKFDLHWSRRDGVRLIGGIE